MIRWLVIGGYYGGKMDIYWRNMRKYREYEEISEECGDDGEDESKCEMKQSIL